MGIESFDNKVIELTGRKTGNGKTIIDLIRFAKSIGLFVSVDMMAGLPGQTDSSFLSDIKKVSIPFTGPDHHLSLHDPQRNRKQVRPRRPQTV